MARLLPGIEEGAETWWKGIESATVPEAAMMSIAISMKRVADEICGVPYDNAPGADNSRHKMGLVDGVMHAIEQGMLAASNRG